MRFLLTLILTALVGSYGWGWVTHVYAGSMSTRRYTEYYWQELNDGVRRSFEKAGAFVDFIKKPLPGAKEFQY